ncbi:MULTISPECIES: hypothetical protein [Rothia]|uniref:hypothetical protein n=1 Tax=Rothia TaxID=32207 RepID=UPI000F89A83B|nr:MULTISPECIES: hypothetical protein [Rothia]
MKKNSIDKEPCQEREEGGTVRERSRRRVAGTLALIVLSIPALYFIGGLVVGHHNTESNELVVTYEFFLFFAVSSIIATACVLLVNIIFLQAWYHDRSILMKDFLTEIPQKVGPWGVWGMLAALIYLLISPISLQHDPIWVIVTFSSVFVVTRLFYTIYWDFPKVVKVSSIVIAKKWLSILFILDVVSSVLVSQKIALGSVPAYSTRIATIFKNYIWPDAADSVDEMALGVRENLYDAIGSNWYLGVSLLVALIVFITFMRRLHSPSMPQNNDEKPETQ